MAVNLESARDTRTERQAEGAAAEVQNLPTSLRSLGIGVTESSLTTGTRAERTTTTGSLAGDEFFETDTGYRYRWDGIAWAYEVGIYVATDAARVALTITAEDNGALFYATDTGILWKVVAAAWVNEFVTIAVTTQFKVGANKVIGARGAAVNDVASADATDLATALTLANETKAQLNALLARVRAATGHGLMA